MSYERIQLWICSAPLWTVYDTTGAVIGTVRGDEHVEAFRAAEQCYGYAAHRVSPHAKAEG